MEMFGNTDLGRPYTNSAQQARVISETWIAQNAYCLSCDSDRLTPTLANTQTRDFVCGKCKHGYELKSKRGKFSTSVLDGAYGTMLKTIRERRTPTFLLLEYSAAWSIQRLRAIHHSLITEDAIKPRKPLSASARRAGWTGCSIVLPLIALQGQIPIINDGLFSYKNTSRESFARLERLASLSNVNRTWAATVLRMVDSLPGARFSLQKLMLLSPNSAVFFRTTTI